MPENINLIPNEVIQERSLKSTFNKVLYVSFGILALVLVAFGLSFYFNYSSSKKIKSIKDEISRKENDIKNLSSIEREGSRLTARLKFIGALLNNKVYYSNVMEEMENRITAGIVINSVDVSDDFTVSISGSASSTNALQNYVLKLVEEPDNLFSDARILSVSIKEGGDASFRISVLADSTNLIGDQ